MGLEQGTWLDAQRAAFKNFGILSRVTQSPGGIPVASGEYVRGMLGEPIKLAHQNNFASEEDILTALNELNAMLERAGFPPVTLKD